MNHSPSISIASVSRQVLGRAQEVLKVCEHLAISFEREASAESEESPPGGWFCWTLVLLMAIRPKGRAMNLHPAGSFSFSPFKAPLLGGDP
ncbi:hypothetical protein AVEN_133789-1 [Araneus ventricosus]|uniref:Uncharacterized protein n=1 Tax=Araneus ventricosus TaxID=182803 RepID=A0A4Y2L0W9_ARAVE|nr:hypothetical protein AVEN_133789-1 [Araneus ventricosus]